MTDIDLNDRYSRQMLFSRIGKKGQERIARSRMLLVGVGALGTHIAETMIRAGVGFLTLVDWDRVELTNLPRQSLFDEQDVVEKAFKAEAAARKLRRINSSATIKVVTESFEAKNALRIAEGYDLILDGTDNMRTRYLINDVAVMQGIPYFYGGVVGATGMAMPVIPKKGPCFKCLFPEMPEADDLPTCHTIGVIEPAVSVVAALESADALRYLTEGEDQSWNLMQFDLWSRDFQKISIKRNEDCPVCSHGRFRFLAGDVQ